MKLISWKFSDLRGTDLAIGNHVLVSLGQWDGLMFSIYGWGLSKAERECFDTKFLRLRNVLNLYLGRIVVSYDKRGICEHLCNVKIVSEVRLTTVLSQTMKSWVLRIKNRYQTLLNRNQFKTIYDFTLYRSWEGYYSFKADLLSAFQLASNYEADLYLKGKGMIYSPLGFEYEYNREQVATYLGKRFLTGDRYDLRGYKDPRSPEIVGYKRIPD